MPEPLATVPSVDSPRVAYCGFADTANIGDYALFKANVQLFGRLSLVPGTAADATVSLFGGGTGYPYSLRYGRYPRRRINVAIGLGVEDPAFVGRFGPLTVLAMHLARFKVFGVRGYRSQRILARHRLSTVVTGDTALALEPATAIQQGVMVPAGISTPQEAKPARVGVCLVGERMQRVGDAGRTVGLVTEYCRRLAAEGCEVVLLPFCRADLDTARTMQLALGPGTRLVDFWSPSIGEDLHAFLAEVAQLRFMVAERLHAAVLAAALGVPFVALPYKPKCLDFVESVSADARLRLDYEYLTPETLWERTREAMFGPRAADAEVAASVSRYRRLLRDTAAEIETLVLHSA